MKTLSILIPTLHSRTESLARLMQQLQPQLCDEVEVLTELDGGESSIGAKRSKLARRASEISKYAAFVDDDDLVSGDYIRLVLDAVKSNPDVVGLRGLITVNGKPHTAKPFYHTMRYDRWFEDAAGFYRPCNHLNPVRTSIMAKITFKEVNHGEDHDYSNRIQPFLNTEVYVDSCLYLYDFWQHKNELRQNVPPPLR